MGGVERCAQSGAELVGGLEEEAFAFVDVGEEQAGATIHGIFLQCFGEVGKG